LTTLAFVQARMGSTRLPGKVLAPLAGRPSLLRIVDRLGAARAIDGVAVLTSELADDDEIVGACEAEGVTVVRGSEADVLGRFHVAAERLGPERIVRVTADCPLVDPEVVDALLALGERPGVAYASVATGAIGADRGYRRFPDGLDAETFGRAALHEAWSDARDPYEREHVTPFIWRRPERFPAAVLEAEVDLGRERWTVDHPADLELVQAIYERLGADGRVFGYREVLEELDRDPALRELNAAFRVADD
jgi:spore coat polysaccharide biosynthesis protein SpsF